LEISEYALGSDRRHLLQFLVPGFVYTIVVAILAALQIFPQSFKSKVNRLLRNV
jgi:hypothetical protein